jgi:hypothetical protein
LVAKNEDKKSEEPSVKINREEYTLKPKDNQYDEIYVYNSEEEIQSPEFENLESEEENKREL